MANRISDGWTRPFREDTEGGIFYGWWMVGAGFLMKMLYALLVFQAFGAYVAVLREEFGWSKTLFAVAFSMSRVESGAMGPAQGWLVDRIGPRAAREMLFTGRQFDAAQAERMGFVTRVVADTDLDEAVDAVTAEIAANAPLSILAIKVAIGEALKPPTERDRALCDALAAACNRSEDYREGQRAFAERRSPEFRGR